MIGSRLKTKNRPAATPSRRTSGRLRGAPHRLAAHLSGVHRPALEHTPLGTALRPTEPTPGAEGREGLGRRLPRRLLIHRVHELTREGTFGRRTRCVPTRNTVPARPSQVGSGRACSRNQHNAGGSQVTDQCVPHTAPPPPPPVTALTASLAPGPPGALSERLR